MFHENKPKALLGLLLSLLLALVAAVTFVILGQNQQKEIKPVPQPSPSQSQSVAVGNPDPALGDAKVAAGMYQVLSAKNLPPISGTAQSLHGKEKAISALQWAASFATMSTYWSPLYAEPLKDDPKWVPGYFSDFIDHLSEDKKVEFGTWTGSTESIIQNMPKIGSLILVPAESMKFDYPAVAERGYGPAIVDAQKTADGQIVYTVKFEFRANMYFFKNGKRMVMGILRNIDYDLVENPADKEHPWLLLDWRPIVTYSTYTAKPEPKPTEAPTQPAPAPSKSS